MAFRFRIDEPITKGFRRVGTEQIERARRQLAANADPSVEVHEARKCLKRIRALLRLGRAGLGEAAFRAENAQFRSIASSLASARDDHVLLETITKLTAEGGGRVGPALLRLKEAVLAQRAPVADGAADGRADAVAALERALRRFRRLSLAPDSFDTLERGLVRNYRKGLAARDAAFASNTDEAYHDWRKCVQTHWRHMALLSRAWPALFEAHIEAARALSQTLGDDHDLALLREKLAALQPGSLSIEDVQAIEDLIRARQAALRLAARSQGDMIFAERPKAHGRRIAAVWAAAVARSRSAARSGKDAAPAKGARAKAPGPVEAEPSEARSEKGRDTYLGDPQEAERRRHGIR
ncbi:CHAD domain-containing protein [Hyphomicrobium sp.]|uniref:CHAD domain-containing protein n=1 Tax=Hyphomicrobium sp. TaxID=82 RepID=UPI0025C2460B|nr:CHAD domain-containing protein [Hyphomicrobium sp.]MCC7251745.1 CHAD domain-containing protein [Hyphomicrobium sp.]